MSEGATVVPLQSGRPVVVALDQLQPTAARRSGGAILFSLHQLQGISGRKAAAWSKIEVKVKGQKGKLPWTHI